MEDTIRWTVKVSPETDRSLRSYLGRHGMKKGDLSKFIERAVMKEILTQTAVEVKKRNADFTGDELQALIDDAVSAVRKEIRAENRAAAIKNVFVALAKKSKASGYSDYWSTSTETVRVLRVEYDFTKAVPK